MSASNDVDVLNRALESMTLTGPGYYPRFIETLPGDNTKLMAHVGHCHLPRECYTFLPMYVPEEHSEGVHSQIICTLAEMPLLAVYPMITPIFACLTTGKPSCLVVEECDRRIHANFDEYARLYEESAQEGKTPRSFFLENEHARDLVNEVQALTIARDSEVDRCRRAKSRAWPLHVSSYAVCYHYQVIVHTLLAFASEQDLATRKHFSDCYDQMRNHIDALVHDMLGEGSNVVEWVRQRVNALNTNILVYSRGQADFLEGFDRLARDYTQRCICFMEQCIMTMIGVPKEHQPALTHDVQKAIDEDAPDFHDTDFFRDQQMLMETRCAVSAPMWNPQRRLQTEARTVGNIYAKPEHLAWMSDQFVRRVASAQRREETVDEFVYRVQIGSAAFETCELQFF